MTIFRSLRVRNYRLFASGQVVSLTGTWMQRVAQDWLVLELSHNSGTAIGITTGLQFLPLLVFGLYGGVLADRYSKRMLLVWAQVAMGLCALLLGVLDITGVVALWHVYALAFALGVASALDTPVRQAFVTELVGPEELTNAVSLNSATFNTGRIFGPAIAGVMISRVGTAPVFLANAGSFAAVITGLLLMRESEMFLVGRTKRAAGQLREGVRYVRTRPELLLPIVLVGLVGTFGFNFQITMALLAKTTFHRGAGAYGLLSTMLAVGSLLGALVAAGRKRPRFSLLFGGAFAFGVLEVVVGLMPTYASFAALLLPVGIATITFTTAANTSIQLASAPEMRGRVMAIYIMVFLGGTPVGAPLIGYLADVFGPRSTLVVGGVVSALSAVVIGVLLARRRDVHVARHSSPRPHLHVGGVRMPPRRVAAGMAAGMDAEMDAEMDAQPAPALPERRSA
ncbi:MAG: MFS transporter [Actinomycetota bacterium]|nr:MFS transporter [Actinomycetota bacterium]